MAGTVAPTAFVKSEMGARIRADVTAAVGWRTQAGEERAGGAARRPEQERRAVQRRRIRV